MAPRGPSLEMPTFLTILLVVSGLFVAGATVLFGFSWRKRSRARLRAMRAAALLASVLFCLVALEYLFYDVIVLNAGFGMTLAEQRWQEKWGGPFNSQGYRDVEHSPESLRTKKVAIVVGDSFAEGSGIKDIRDRFPDLVAARLGDDWEFVNVARGGWETEQHYAAITGYPTVPDMILLSYYINDITSITPTLGDSSFWITPPPEWLRPVVDNSYFFNYVYWKLYRLSAMQRMGRGYTDFIVEAYDDPAIWAQHVRALRQIVDYAQSRQIRLVVVVFPELAEIERTAPITHRVAEVFAERGVPVLDLAPVLGEYDYEGLMVNSMDSHPNEKANAIVADHLYRLLVSLGLQNAPVRDRR